jgi:hypothetical protein
MSYSTLACDSLLLFHLPGDPLIDLRSQIGGGFLFTVLKHPIKQNLTNNTLIDTIPHRLTILSVSAI